MNRKVKFSILAIVILIVTSIYLISQQEIEPPPATLKIEGTEQISGIGSYCWKGTWKALCVDYAGIPTVQEPMLASSSFTAHIHLPLQERPYDLRLNVVQVKEQDEFNFSAYDWRLWNTKEGKHFNLTLENEQDIELSIEPGLYVLNIEAWWKEKGSASYGFLVEVRADGTVASPKIDLSKIKKHPNDGDYLSSEGYSTKILLSGGEYPTTLDSKILLLNYSLNYSGAISKINLSGGLSEIPPP
jgi:hypothetical protein